VAPGWGGLLAWGPAGLKEQGGPAPQGVIGVGGRDNRGLRHGGAQKLHVALRQPPAPETVRVRQERQIALVGQEGMDPRIWSHDHRARQIRGPQHRVSRLVEGEVDEPVVDEIDRLAADRNSTPGHGQIARICDDDPEPSRLQ